MDRLPLLKVTERCLVNEIRRRDKYKCATQAILLEVCEDEKRWAGERKSERFAGEGGTNRCPDTRYNRSPALQINSWLPEGSSILVSKKKKAHHILGFASVLVDRCVFSTWRYLLLSSGRRKAPGYGCGFTVEVRGLVAAFNFDSYCQAYYTTT